MFSVNIPANQYTELQFYATGGNGGSTVNYTLTYSTGTPTSSTISLPDWCEPPNPLPSGEYTLAALDRISNGGLSDTDGLLCNIYALDVPVDSARTLTQFSFSDTGGSTNYLVFYGATLW